MVVCLSLRCKGYLVITKRSDGILIENMGRITELCIILSTLLAIVSTFFLYRSHTISPNLTASVIQATETVTEETPSNIPALDTSTSTMNPTSVSSLESTEEIEEMVTPPLKKEIIIEKLPITGTEIETLTTRIHSLTNLSRSQNKLSSLTLDEALSRIAKKRSEDMIKNNYFSHTSPSGCDLTCTMKKSGYQTLSWGENLALSHSYHLYTLPELAQTFISDWLESSTHRDNLLSKRFTHQGIGVAAVGEKVVVTVIFAAP